MEWIKATVLLVMVGVGILFMVSLVLAFGFGVGGPWSTPEILGLVLLAIGLQCLKGTR